MACCKPHRRGTAWKHGIRPRQLGGSGSFGNSKGPASFRKGRSGYVRYIGQMVYTGHHFTETAVRSSSNSPSQRLNRPSQPALSTVLPYADRRNSHESCSNLSPFRNVAQQRHTCWKLLGFRFTIFAPAFGSPARENSLEEPCSTDVSRLQM